MIRSVLGLVVSFLLLSPVLAQPPGERPPNPRREALLKRFDANGNGRLDSEERRKAMKWLRTNRDKLPPATRPGGPPPPELGGPDGPPPGAPGGRGGQGGGRIRRSRDVNERSKKLVARFDADGNGVLTRPERDAARAWLKENASQGRGGRGGRRPGGGRGGRGGDARPKIEPHRVEKGSVKTYEGKGLYDADTFRTLFIDFEHDDWYEEVSAFYRSDVNVPATLTVDGKTYEGVGVAFRGNSSYFGVGGKKKSLNLVIDHEKKQDLLGYRTLNLLNGHVDPSFIRSVLFNRICREYMPSQHANLVKLVINGESWGVYINVQQFNKDFLRDWYGTRGGVRWKVPAGSARVGAFAYDEDLEVYKKSFQLKTRKAPEESWKRLQELTRILKEASDEELEAQLRPYLDIDQTLWYLALDNVLMDGDGYLSRASDYNLYLAEDGRFHLVPHDSNEALKGGGGGPGSRNYPRDFRLDPLWGANDERPLVKRLFGIPHLQQRYLAHVKTIVDEWMSWDQAGPICEAYHALIDAEVARDDKCLYGYAAFKSSLVPAEKPAEPEDEGGNDRRRRRRRTPSLSEFINDRGRWLKEHDLLAGQWPTFGAIRLQGESLVIRPGKGTVAKEMILHTATTDRGPFTAHPMQKTASGAWHGEIPTDARRWYVELRDGTRTVFLPWKAEFGAEKK